LPRWTSAHGNVKTCVIGLLRRTGGPDGLGDKVAPPICALQLDDGSEFAAEFEAGATRPALVRTSAALPPTEWRRRTRQPHHTKEFYQVTLCSLE